MALKKQPVFILTPFVAGVLIYFACRTRRLLYYEWIPFKGLLHLDFVHAVSHAKCLDILGAGRVFDILVFSLPAAFFAFSLTYYLNKRYLASILKTISLPQRLGGIVIVITVMALVPELCQAAGLLPGRYDLLDVTTAAIASGAAFVLD